MAPKIGPRIVNSKVALTAPLFVSMPATLPSNDQGNRREASVLTDLLNGTLLRSAYQTVPTTNAGMLIKATQ
jgi:hypothetical protein